MTSDPQTRPLRFPSSKTTNVLMVSDAIVKGRDERLRLEAAQKLWEQSHDQRKAQELAAGTRCANLDCTHWRKIHEKLTGRCKAHKCDCEAFQ